MQFLLQFLLSLPKLGLVGDHPPSFLELDQKMLQSVWQQQILRQVLCSVCDIPFLLRPLALWNFYTFHIFQPLDHFSILQDVVLQRFLRCLALLLSTYIQNTVREFTYLGFTIQVSLVFQSSPDISGEYPVKGGLKTR